MICHSYVQTCCTICWVWAFQIEDVTFIDVSMSSMNEASMEVIVMVGWMIDVPCDSVIGRMWYHYSGLGKEVHASCACDI